jgi:hypothetical protein
MIRALVVSLFFFASGAAIADAKADAIRDGAMDCVTTGAGIAFGLTEMNPIGPVASCALKGAIVEMAAGQDEPARTQALHSVNAVWGAAAANNVLALMGAGVASPVFGVMVAIGLWASGEGEREFMKACAIHRQLANDQTLKCIYRG